MHMGSNEATPALARSLMRRLVHTRAVVSTGSLNFSVLNYPGESQSHAARLHDRQHSQDWVPGPRSSPHFSAE